tara:strand:- start:1176 stop:3917 length:2742 start_codon:yes stop_codon:yes gene_type:complete
MVNDPTQTDELLSGIESFTPDHTATNWKQELEDLVDGYRTAIEKINVHSILHSVQKDGIQNGWDGRLGIYGPKIPWQLTFELLEDSSLIRQNSGKTKMTLLTITDEGTVGLTGRHIHEDDLYEDISQEERLARFENKSWQKDKFAKRKTQGSRGRGKFIFVGASKVHTIFYDSLRYKINYDSKNNVIENKPLDYGQTQYMFGWRKIDDVTAPYKSWFDSDAKATFSKITKNFGRENELVPLSQPGTRVIIPQPLDEIVESFKNGELEKWIGSTFWDIIVNCDAKIVIKYNGKETVVKPYPQKYPDKDTNTHYSTVLSDENIHPDLKKYRDSDGHKQDMSCLKFHIVYSHNYEVPEEYRGIAIIRAGMKIQSYTPTLVPAEDRKHLFGYITLGDGWDEPIKEKENKEHYEISMRGHPLSYLQTFLDEQIEKFGIEKGIWDSSTAAKKNEMREKTQSRVMSAANRIARKFGLGVGPGGDDKKYKVFMDTLSETPNGDLQMYGGSTTQRGEKAKTSDSTLIGKIPKKVTFALKRKGTPTGTASVDITDENGDVKQNIGTISEEELQKLSDSEYKKVPVEKKNASYVMEENDQVLINYSDGDSSNHICAISTASAIFDASNSVITSFEKSWQTDDNSDAIMKIEGTIPQEDVDPKPVRLVMPALKFPDKNHPMRVNYGEMVKGITVYAINERNRLDPNASSSSPAKVHVLLELFIGEPGNGKVHQQYDKMLNDNVALVDNQLMEITPQGSPLAISFKEENFPSIGRYTLVATLISMEDDDTRGDPIDRITKAIYLEEDPPKHGLFEKMEASNFSAPNEKLECKIVKGSHESYNFMYNTGHPEFERNGEERDELFAYLLRLMIGQIAKIDMRQGGEDKCQIFKQEDFADLETMGGKEKIVQRTLAFVSEALFDNEEEA